MSWDYLIEELPRKQLAKLGPSAAAEILHYLDTRIRGSENPALFGKALRGSKHGLWRFRVRDWRLICRLERSVLIVIVVEVGHRSTVYDE